MLGLSAQFCVRTITPGFGSVVDQPSVDRSSNSWFSSCSLQLSIVKSGFNCIGCRRAKSILVSCQSSRDSFGGRSRNGGDDSEHDYFEASLLVSETILHYRMWKRGFQEETNFNKRELIVNTNSLGLSFLKRFQSPTVFLKISCNGDFLLPIVVGEFAIEKLIEGQLGIENGDSPDLFEFVGNLVMKIGYEVTMVRITERVVNAYFARLYFSKAGENDMLIVDTRPSDALNIAYRCKVPILVSKQIVHEDAIRISYGIGRARGRKSCYDVSLDSAADGPDFLTEELDMLKNMKLAIREERYEEAAMWRDKLTKLRKSIHEQ